MIVVRPGDPEWKWTDDEFIPYTQPGRERTDRLDRADKTLDCRCRPGDGSETCEREEECFGEWLESVRPLTTGDDQ